MYTYKQVTNRFFSFYLPVAMCGVLLSSSAMANELLDLGENVTPLAVSNTGVVVGASNTNQSPSTAFRWSVETGLELIDGTSANAVNDNGQIAGTTITGAFVLDGNRYRDWSDYGAFGINQSGEVAGYKVGSNPYQARSLPFNPALYIGSKWEVYDIARLYPRGTRPGVYADRFVLSGINLGGYTVGYKYRYGLAGTSAILIDSNVAVNDQSDVVFLPTGGGRAADINDQNIVTGTSGGGQAYIYDHNSGNLTNLPVLAGGLSSGAYDINELNQVVGSSQTLVGSSKIYHAFVWDETDGVTDLNNTGIPAGWVLTAANAINDKGDIVGVGTLNGVSHGFMLTTNQAVTQPPLAVASANKYSGKAPLTVNFDAAVSTDPDGFIVGYEWDFDDGSNSADINPTHEFTSAGSYVVTLTVTDNDGLQASTSITIRVRKGRRK